MMFDDLAAAVVNKEMKILISSQVCASARASHLLTVRKPINRTDSDYHPAAPIDIIIISDPRSSVMVNRGDNPGD